MSAHRVGVIGCGVWGTHALQEILLRQPGVELAAVSSHDRWGYGVHADPVAAGRQYAAGKGCAFRDDWRQVATDPDIDVLSVMTSPASKPEPVILGLEQGKSIVMDKPLALDVASARRMVEAEATSTGVGFVLCGYQNTLPCERLARLIADGGLGELLHVDVRLYFTGGVYPGFTPTPRYRSEVPGGELTVIGTHAIQTLLAVTGRRPLAVDCRTGQRFYDEYRAVGYEDWAEVLLTLEGGVTAGISVARLPHRPQRALPLLEVSGSRGYALVQDDEEVVWPGPERLSLPETTDARYDRVFGQFLGAVEGDGPSPVSFAALLVVQQVLAAAYESAASGRPVDVG